MQKKKEKEFWTECREPRPIPIPSHVLCEALFNRLLVRLLVLVISEKIMAIVFK